jgi:hypothetical protein
MQSTSVAALVASLRATPSRRAALTALLGGLPGLLLTAGIEDAAGKNRRRKGKGKKQQRRQRRKDRRPNCDVCRSGCKFTSLQAAIDAAASGDGIRLCAGVFTESVRILKKDLSLIGAGDDALGTTLDGRDVITTMVGIQDATVTLEGLRIAGAAGAFGGGISSQRSTLTLTTCTVSGNTAAAGGGIYKQNGNLTLRDCTVTDNAVGLQGGGIHSDGGDLVLVDSRVEGNRAGSGGGIFRANGTVTLQDSVVTGNTPDNCVGVTGCG